VSGATVRAKPEEVLFGRLRRNLALMYAVVLAAMLAAMAVALYLALRRELLLPVAERTLGRAQFQAAAWAEGRQGPCSPPGAAGPGTPPARPPDEGRMWAVCYDAAGTVFRANAEPPTPGAPVTVADTIRVPTLVERTLRDGVAGDLVDAGPGFGVVTRQAAVARSAAGQTLGVVLIAQPVTEQLETLALVRNLLLGLGALVVMLATGGGWLLAKRALGPARLAFARQQAFISDASHEFRTPLTLMRANAELLLRHRDRMPEEDAEVLDEIVSETEHMSRLANDLLTLARLDAGKLELEREIVDLSDVARDLVRRVGALAEERSITLREAEDGGARPLVFADAQYTHEAGLILVENAVKYTPAGGTVTVRTEVHGAQAALVVEDTGVGIPKEHVHRRGERFFRADASRNRATGGTGLGLAIAFRIARAHGGAIELESEPRKGTRAALRLPAATL
jgi:signal transduction histidine kinase